MSAIRQISTSLTIAEYDALIASGAFGEGDHIELIRGEVIEMAPAGESHDESLSALLEVFQDILRHSDFRVRTQMGINFPGSSRPEPDFAIVRRGVANRRSNAVDVVLIVEVSESSHAFDRSVKYGLYASAGVPEYWIINLGKRQVEVFRNPDASSATYRTELVFRAGETMSCAAFSEILVEVARLL